MPARRGGGLGRRVHGLTVDLYLIAQQARQDIERLESARTFVAFLEQVEIEESSRRGLVTLRLPSGETEPIRTEQVDTDRGRALIDGPVPCRDGGCWYTVDQRKTGSRISRSGCLTTCRDLGGDGPRPAPRRRRWCCRRPGET